jgi:hypothetical protein
MKIIEGMKEVKRLEEKVEDLKKKIGTFCADMSIETPMYPDQTGQIKEWLQSCHDSLKEAERIRLAINKTNLATPVTIEVGGVKVEKSIAAWIIRRRLYANQEQSIWTTLGDKGLREGIAKNSAGENIEVKIRRYYDPKMKDQKVNEYREEPNLIDRTLEVVNAVTDLI